MEEASTSERTNSWLADQLAQLWQNYFADVPKPNEVFARFGRKSTTRLGSIQLMKRGNLQGASVVTLSGYMRSKVVPEYVLQAVLAHELVHYSHGFQSPLPQLCKYPHQGGIVDKEIRRRGLGSALTAQKKWTKANWLPTIHHLHQAEKGSS